MDSTPKKSGKWTPEMERDLYGACLVVLGEPKGATLTQAVELLKKHQGATFTVKAASHRVQHLQKLKRKEGSTTSTPAGAGKKTGGKRGKTAAVDDEDDEDGVETPAPKKRARASKKSQAVKAEEPDEKEEDIKPVKYEQDGYESEGI